MTQNPKHVRSGEACSESPQIERPVKVAKTQYLSDQEEEEQEDQLTSISRQPMNPNSRVQRYLFAVEYIGTRFSGSQKQPKFRTVVGALEDAFRKFIGHPVSVTCSSRTDAGVHALSNIFHVDIERTSKRKPGEVLPPHEPSVVKRAMNHFLQNEGDLTVIDVRCVPFDFHARFRAQERIYFYRLLSGPELLSTFEKDRAWHVPEELSLQAMQEACKILIGCHDFSSFRAAGCQAKSPIRTLDELNVTEVVPGLYFPSTTERQINDSTVQNLNGFSIKPEDEIAHSSMSTNNKITALDGHIGIEFGQRSMHRCFVITARARAFLYHQVRLLVGVLKAVGTGSLTVLDVERILNAKTVTAASPMAPACGLFLGQVSCLALRWSAMRNVKRQAVALHSQRECKRALSG